MIDTLLKESSSLLDRRFIVNALLPVALFVAALGTVVASTTGGLGRLVTWFDRQPGTTKWLAGIALVVALITAAALLSSRTTGLIRLYEGYWTTPPGHLAARAGRGWHRARLARLAADPAGYDRIYRGYPLPTQPRQVMPTRLGNVLRNAELYPRDRYGLDAIIAWPRLYPLLPDPVVARLAAARADLEFLVVVSALAAAFAVLSGGYLLIAGAPWWAFVACFLGGAIVARSAYQGAVEACAGYADHVKVAFDLYRRELLKHVAPDATEERAHWQGLVALWYRNVPGAVEDPRPIPDPPATNRARMSVGAWLALLTLAIALAGALYLAATA